jgi:hypothetical protein
MKPETWRKGNPFGRLREYELRHLAEDLEELGPHEKLHRLLLLEDAKGRNAWYEAKDATGAGAGYVADVERARQILIAENRDKITGGQGPPDVVTEFRYLLSIGVQASRMSLPPWMMVAFVAHELWSGDQALAYVQRIPTWREKLQAVTALTQILDGDHLLSAQKLSLSLMGAGPGTMKKRSSVDIRDKSGEWATSDYKLCADCLETIVPGLADALVPAALATARTVGGSLWHVRAMRPALSRPSLADRFAEVDREYASVSANSAGYWRAEELCVLAPLASEDQRARRIEEGLRAAIDVLDDFEAKRFRLQTPITGEFMLLQTMELVWEEDLRALKEIAPHLTVELIRAAIARSQSLSQEARECALSLLLPHLARREGAEKALDGAEEIESAYLRNVACARILAYLSDAKRAALLRRVQKEVDGIASESGRMLCRHALVASIAGGKGVLYIKKMLAQEPSYLDDLAPTIEALPVRSRRAVFADFKNGGAISVKFAPYLPRKIVQDLHKEQGRLELGKAAAEFAEKLKRAASSPTAVTTKPDFPAGTICGDLVIEALRSADGLQAADRARAITLAAQIVAEDKLAALLDLVPSIQNDYLSCVPLDAIMSRSGAELRASAGKKLLQALFSLHGGIEGAEGFFQSAVASGMPLAEMYECWTEYLSSLEHESGEGILRYFAPVAAVSQALGGAEAITKIEMAAKVVDRWWGKRTPAPTQLGPKPSSEGASPPPRDSSSEQSKNSETKNRFEFRPVPDNEQAIVIELIQTLAANRAFQSALGLLSGVEDMAGKHQGWEAAEQTATDLLLSELAQAQEFGRCKELLKRARSVSASTWASLARNYISHSQLDEAHSLYEEVRTRFAPEQASPIAAELIEAMVAEGQLNDALAIFQATYGSDASSVSPSIMASFVDIAFMMANAAGKAGQRAGFDAVIDALLSAAHRSEDRQKIASRLLDYATRLQQHGEDSRARAWQSISRQISEMGSSPQSSL